MYQLYAELPLQTVCQRRQFGGLLRWAAFIIAQPIPVEKPSVAFVQQRIVAGFVPIQTNSYVTRTIGYTVESPNVQTNIRQHLSPWNDEATEAAMDANVDGALAVGMPLFCATEVTAAQIEQWYTDNGFNEPEEPPVVLAQPRPTAPPM